MNEQKAKKKLPYIIAILLFVVGVGLIAYKPIVNHFITPKVLDSKLEQSFKDLDKKLINENKDKAKNASDKDFDYSNVELLSGSLKDLNPKVDKSKIIGEIYIPQVDLHLPITYGTTNENLLYSATTMKKEQSMGEGNYALAGHNAVDESVLFAPLHRVKNNDYIYITDKEKVYKYLINDITVVKPSEVAVIDDIKSEKMITLVTCEDFAGLKRLIVQGVLVDSFDYEKDLKLEKALK